VTVAVSQIYAQVGVSFPFSWHFQRLLTDKLTEVLRPSPKFSHRYGDDFTIIFRISAKAEIADIEIRGPTVYKKAKDVEYSIFLPYKIISQEGGKEARYNRALEYLFMGMVKVLQSLEINTTALENAIPLLVKEVFVNPLMLEKEDS
jgi:hypothetical protein